MGQNKAILPFLGVPLIQHVVQRVASIANEILIVANDPSPYGFLGLPIVADHIPGQGALGGLLTALTYSSHPYTASIACDMPLVNARLLATELDLLLAEAADVVIPESASGLEPLHAVFRREACLPFVEEAIKNKERRLISWFHQVKVRTMTRAEVALIDPHETAFMNINTPAEFASLESFVRSDH